MKNNSTKQSHDLYNVDGVKRITNNTSSIRTVWILAKQRAAELKPYISSTDEILEYSAGPVWELVKIKAKK